MCYQTLFLITLHLILVNTCFQEDVLLFLFLFTKCVNYFFAASKQKAVNFIRQASNQEIQKCSDNHIPVRILWLGILQDNALIPQRIKVSTMSLINQMNFSYQIYFQN